MVVFQQYQGVLQRDFQGFYVFLQIVPSASRAEAARTRAGSTPAARSRKHCFMPHHYHLSRNKRRPKPDHRCRALELLACCRRGLWEYDSCPISGRSLTAVKGPHMTYCAGWKYADSVFLLGDAAATKRSPPNTPRSSFGELHAQVRDEH